MSPDLTTAVAHARQDDLRLEAAREARAALAAESQPTAWAQAWTRSRTALARTYLSWRHQTLGPVDNYCVTC